MTEPITNLFTAVDRTQEQALGMMEKIFAAAQSRAVFSEPVQSGSFTVITASEVVAGGGFGFGKGFGPTPGPSVPAATTPDPGSSPDLATGVGGGGGGGGGGGASGRPVAVIVIGPDGVTVRPVIDVTKVVLAALTAWGVMLPLLMRMRRGRTT